MATGVFAVVLGVDGGTAVDNDAFVVATVESRALLNDKINGMIIIDWSINSHILLRLYQFST
jgi:hypothetical protein